MEGIVLGKSEMRHYSSALSLVEALLAGSSAREVQADLLRLSSRAERQAVLCTCCSILKEVGGNCHQRANEITQLLTENCELYQLDRKVCGLSLLYGMELETKEQYSR